MSARKPFLDLTRQGKKKRLKKLLEESQNNSLLVHGYEVFEDCRDVDICNNDGTFIAARLDLPRRESTSNLEFNDNNEEKEREKRKRTRSKRQFCPEDLQFVSSDEEQCSSQKKENKRTPSSACPTLETPLKQTPTPSTPQQNKSACGESFSQSPTSSQPSPDYIEVFIKEEIPDRDSDSLDSLNQWIKPLDSTNSKLTTLRSGRSVGNSSRTSVTNEQVYEGILQLQATLTDVYCKIKSVEQKVNSLMQHSSLPVQHSSLPMTNSSLPIVCPAEDIEVDDGLGIALLSSLPIKTMDNFCVMEKKLKESPELKKKFVRILMSVGGNDVRTLAMNIMRRVMSDHLAVDFSYTGKKGYRDERTEPFGNTEICGSIHSAVRKVYPYATEEHIKKYIMGYLNQARVRLIRREQRASTKEADK